MPYYKDSKNALYFLDDSAFVDLLPADCIEISDIEAAALQAPPAPTIDQLIKQYESALDAHLDGVARQHRYDDRKSFALRAGYVGPYQSEGIAFAQWMDNCNVQAYALLGEVLDGTTSMPTIQAFIATLPVFVLP